jgi:hypothetical protein
MDSQAIPLVVGVTGHRKLRAEDLGRLRAAVAGVFDALHKKYADTPLLVLSSLAEGADRLVAEVARERGIPFIVPLPMEQKEYERDFAEHDDPQEAENSLKDFTRLMEAAEASFVVSLSPAVMAEDLRGEKRAEQYAMAGKFILRHSHILLALWDGEKGEKTGGTAQMVRYRLTGFPRRDVPEWASLFPHLFHEHAFFPV